MLPTVSMALARRPICRCAVAVVRIYDGIKIADSGDYGGCRGWESVGFVGSFEFFPAECATWRGALRMQVIVARSPLDWNGALEIDLRMNVSGIALLVTTERSSTRRLDGFWRMPASDMLLVDAAENSGQQFYGINLPNA